MRAENLRFRRAADQGCGKLRHFSQLAQNFNAVWFVDQPEQLDRVTQQAGLSTTIRQYVEQMAETRRQRLRAISDADFARASLNLDAVFAVAVFDVVPRIQRIALAGAARQNLRSGGVYIVISPRNDTSRLRRCRRTNRYQDGHIFSHHGAHTFWCNFRDANPLIRLVTRRGFRVSADLSSYRHVCVIFEAI